MALSHLINCILLVYAPLFIVYKAKNLSDYRAHKIVLAAAGSSLLTSFCKIFLMASFSVSLSETTTNSLVLDLGQYLFNIIDCYGIYLLSKQKLSMVDDMQVRVLSIAIGWSLMDNTLMHLFSLVPYATCIISLLYLIEDEFSETFILRSLYSNMDFFETIILVGLVLTIAKNRKKINFSYFSNVEVLLLILFRSALVPSLVNFLSDAKQNQYKFEQLGYKVLFSSIFVLIGRRFIKL